MDTRFAGFVREYQGRLAVPLCAFSGLEITGESIEDMVSVPGTQFKAVMALLDRYQTPVLATAIDTTAETPAIAPVLPVEDGVEKTGTPE